MAIIGDNRSQLALFRKLDGVSIELSINSDGGDICTLGMVHSILLLLIWFHPLWHVENSCRSGGEAVDCLSGQAQSLWSRLQGAIAR